MMKQKLAKRLNIIRFVIAASIIVVRNLSLGLLTSDEYQVWGEFLRNTSFFTLILLAVAFLPNLRKVQGRPTATSLDTIFLYIWKEDQMAEFRVQLIQTLFAIIMAYVAGPMFRSNFYTIIFLDLVILVLTASIWKNNSDWKEDHVKDILGTNLTPDRFVTRFLEVVGDFGVENPKYQGRIIRAVVLEIIRDLSTSERKLSVYESELLDHINSGLVETSGISFENNLDILVTISETSGIVRDRNIHRLLELYAILDKK